MSLTSSPRRLTRTWNSKPISARVFSPPHSFFMGRGLHGFIQPAIYMNEITFLICRLPVISVSFLTVRAACFVRVLSCVPRGGHILHKAGFWHSNGRSDAKVADRIAVYEIIGAVPSDVQSLADLQNGHNVRVGFKEQFFHIIPARFRSARSQPNQLYK